VYVVTGPVSWHGFVGIGGASTDNIGDPAYARGGLAILSIEYDDGDQGILIVSCRRQQPGVFEGVTASKGFVGYWERQAPGAGIDGNRTLFHVVQK